MKKLFRNTTPHPEMKALIKVVYYIMNFSIKLLDITLHYFIRVVIKYGALQYVKY